MPKKRFPKSFSHKEGYGFVNTQNALNWEEDQEKLKKKRRLKRAKNRMLKAKKRFVAKTKKRKKQGK